MGLWLPTALMVSAAAGSYLLLGPPVLGLVLGMVAGYVLYLFTFRRALPAPKRFLPVYLGAVAWQLLHFLEEYTTGLHVRMPALLDLPPWSTERFLGFNLAFYALFLVSGVALLLGNRPWTCFAAFFVVAGFLNGIGHILFALRVGGYFPGLVTAPGSLVFAIFMVRRMRPEVAPRGAAAPG